MHGSSIAVHCSLVSPFVVLGLLLWDTAGAFEFWLSITHSAEPDMQSSLESKGLAESRRSLEFLDAEWCCVPTNCHDAEAGHQQKNSALNQQFWWGWMRWACSGGVGLVMVSSILLLLVMRAKATFLRCRLLAWW